MHGHQAYEPYGSPKIGSFVKTIDQRGCGGTDEDAVDHGKPAVFVGSGVETPETGAQRGVEQLRHRGQVGWLKRAKHYRIHVTPICRKRPPRCYWR